MDIYDKYKNGRDAAWQTLINSGVNSLPIDLKTIAEAYKISVYSYSKALKNGIIMPEEANGKSFSRFSKGKKQIFVDSNQEKENIRYEIAFQLGHCIMGHYLTGKPSEEKTGSKMSKNDYEAYIFARDLLMPATVLYGIKLHLADDIANVCNVPYRLAKKREERMEELYKRNKFNSSELEKLVFNQFIEYIYNYSN